MIACNDYILLECCIYSILKRHFRGHAAYAQLMDLFHEVGPPTKQSGVGGVAGRVGGAERAERQSEGQSVTRGTGEADGEIGRARSGKQEDGQDV